MSLLQLILYALCIVAGAVIQAVSGFGFGVLVMSIFPYFMPDYQMGLILSGLMGLAITAVLFIQGIHEIQWKLIIAPLITSMFASWAATKYILGLPEQFLNIVLGVFLIFLGIYFIYFEGRIHIRMTCFNGSIAGILAGIINEVFGMGGPPLAVYLLSIADDKKKYLANLSAIFFFICLNTTISRVAAGMIDSSILKYFLIGMIFVIFGMKIGHGIFVRLDAGRLKKAVYLFIIVSGFVMLGRSII